MTYYERTHNLGEETCLCILMNEGINPMNVKPSIELAERIEFDEIDEIVLIIAESEN